MAYEELQKLTEEISKLNKHLDERVKTLEERQNKTETKISQGGPIAAEARQELEKINKKISDEIKDYKKLVAEQKEPLVAAQRPSVPGGYPGSTAGAYKPPATKALEKWIRKGGDASALTMEERSYIDFNHMDMDLYTPEQKVMVSAAADLRGFFSRPDLSDKFIPKLFPIAPLPAYAYTKTLRVQQLVLLPAGLSSMMPVGKAGYRATGTWLMSNSTIGICRLFADTTTRPIWTMFGDVFSETLFGRPIVEMPDMPNQAGTFPAFTAGQFPVIFGDIGQGYQIVDRAGLTFQTLKELFSIQNQVAFLARQRVGGKVVLPEAISVLKMG